MHEKALDFALPCSLLLTLGSCLLHLPSAQAEPATTVEAASMDQGATWDFNRDIRPILSENCFYCHGQDANQRQSGLRLDDRDSVVDYGAIVPHDPESSELVQRIRHTDPDLRMPPADSNRRLSDDQKKMLEAWIAAGAPYARHWAFETPQRPQLPEVEQTGWVRQPIDRFLLARLEAERMSPSPEAERTVLIKRLSIDLIGLPPTPDEVRQFDNDPDPLAYERLVDRLLASPHYGERMALGWLDAARYADSNGFQQDGDTWQWMWRDWVVEALNQDLPFDKFTIWQLAGDLLPNATLEQKIASGFNRNHLLNGEGGAIPEEQRFVNLFDRVDTTATTWLGLTMACAQCHDHKYDPITQRNYYQFLDAFNRVPERGTPQYFSPRIRVAPPFLELPTKENEQRIAEFQAEIEGVRDAAQLAADAAYQGWKLGALADRARIDSAGFEEPLLKLLQKLPADLNDEEKQNLDVELRKHFDKQIRPQLVNKIPAVAKLDELQRQLTTYRNDQVPRVMIMSDEQPRETAILDRGEYLNPTEEVSFGVPEFLPPLPDDASLDRLGLAQWLVAPEHPLTSRVQVNRIWQHFFGSGIVKTSEDFGVQSEYPVHRELLDWLAVEFQEQGWSMKALQRMIVTSATYRQSSRMTEQHRSRDVENRLLARSSRFRMPSLVLRDWALAAADTLHVRISGAPTYPYQPGDVWEALAITKERDFTYPESTGSDLYRRSLYTFWRRTVSPANMFDAANRQTCTVRLATTSTPLHALTTLNDPTWVESARLLAERCLQESGELDECLSQAFHRVLCRFPSDEERQVLRRAYDNQLEIYEMHEESARQLLQVGESERDESLPPAKHAALTAVCLAILNLDEALTRE